MIEGITFIMRLFILLSGDYFGMNNRRGFMIVLGGKNSGNNDTEKAKT